MNRAAKEASTKAKGISIGAQVLIMCFNDGCLG